MMYYLGNGVEQNYAKAKEYFEKAANLGNKDSQEMLKTFYKSEKNNDNKKIENLYKLGQRFYEGNNFKQALEYFEKAAKQGNTEALNKIGVMCFKGEGITKDITKAIEYFEKAANLGNTNALNNLGVICLNEKKDYKKAQEYFEKAADLGHADAMCNIGYIFERGYGLEQDLEKKQKYFERAIEYYTKAAALGNERAQRSLENLSQIKKQEEKIK